MILRTGLQLWMEELIEPASSHGREETARLAEGRWCSLAEAIEPEAGEGGRTLDEVTLRRLAARLGRIVWDLTPRPAEGFRVPAAEGASPRFGSRAVGRNDPCPCGSGAKYKRCCMSGDQALGRVLPPRELEWTVALVAEAAPRTLFDRMDDRALSRAIPEVPPDLANLLAAELAERQRWGLVLKLLKPLAGEGGARAVEEDDPMRLGLLLQASVGAGYTRKALEYLEAGAAVWREDDTFIEYVVEALELFHDLWRVRKGAVSLARAAERHWPDDPEVMAISVKVRLWARDLPGAADAARRTLDTFGDEYFDPETVELLVDTAQDAERAYCRYALRTGLPESLYRRITRAAIELMGLSMGSRQGELAGMELFPAGDGGYRFRATPTEFSWSDEESQSGAEEPALEELERLVERLEAESADLATVASLVKALTLRGEDPTGLLLGALPQATAAVERQASPEARIEWRWPENRPYLFLLRSQLERRLGTGEREWALEVALRLLGHDPSDPFGIRETALWLALATGRNREALDIAERFPGDRSAGILYGRALALRRLYYSREAGAALHEAQAAHPRAAVRFFLPADLWEIPAGADPEALGGPAEVPDLWRLALTEDDRAWLADRLSAFEGAGRAPGEGLAMELLVSLIGLEIPIWRRILIPASASLLDLHDAIQDAMGWLDEHLHRFHLPPADETGSWRYVDGEDEYDQRPQREAAIPLHEVFPHPGSHLVYVYDFGDEWHHGVVLERFVPLEPEVAYPRLVAGAGACPPEDCGGAMGYARLLAALDDPESEQYEWAVEVLGPDWDPHRFHPSAVRFRHPIPPRGSLPSDR